MPDSFQFTNFVRRISRHGLLGSVRLIPVNFWFVLNALKPAAIAARRGERALDRELGINTAGDVPGGATAAEFGISADIYPYQAVVSEDFAEMMGALPQDVSSFCFIDIGSGKGRALVLAARRPFAEVIGVELSARLHRIAEENIAKVGSSLRSRVKLTNQDGASLYFLSCPRSFFCLIPLARR